jgi:hypothetical protein
MTGGFLVLEVFCLLPIIILSFLAFLGIYGKNDYKIYKRSLTSKELVEQDDRSCSNVFKLPQTKEDCKMFVNILVHVVSITVFGVVASFGQDKWYPGFSLGVWILLLEMTWILFTKYRETHYTFTCPVIIILLIDVVLFLGWIAIYSLFVIRPLEEKEEIDFHASLIMFIGLGYSMLVFIGLIMGEYSSKTSETAYTFSFKVIAFIAFLISAAVGVMSVLFAN